MNKNALYALMLIAALTTSAAQAATTTVSFSGNNPSVSGSFSFDSNDQNDCTVCGSTYGQFNKFIIGDIKFTINGITTAINPVSENYAGVTYSGGFLGTDGYINIVAKDASNSTFSQALLDLRFKNYITTGTPIFIGSDFVSGNISLYSGSTYSNFVFGGAISSVAVVPTAVPEPATWTMMFGGFALVGGAMRVRRRRRRRVVMAV